jgi:hypothetical protein
VSSRASDPRNSATEAAERAEAAMDDDKDEDRPPLSVLYVVAINDRRVPFSRFQLGCLSVVLVHTEIHIVSCMDMRRLYMTDWGAVSTT